MTSLCSKSSRSVNGGRADGYEADDVALLQRTTEEHILGTVSLGDRQRICIGLDTALFQTKFLK